MLVMMVAGLLAAGDAMVIQRQPLTIPLVPAPAAASGATVTANGEKLICHEMPLPGTRLVTQHMCGTRAQWDDYNLVMRQDMQRVYQTNWGR